MRLSKLALLPVFLLVMFMFSLPAFAIEYEGNGNSEKHDLGAPDPENYPYFIKQIPVAFYDPGDVRVDEDGNCYLDEVSWGWLHTYTNDEIGSIKDDSRLGLTISFLMRSELPESDFANTTKAEVWIPSRAAPPFGAVIQAFGHQTKLFKLPELIALYNNKMAFNGWTRGQVEGAYLPSDSAMLIQANIPDKTTMLAATNGRAKLTGIHAGIWDELSSRYKEYVNELGERYLRLSELKDGVSWKEVHEASLNHRVNYKVKLRNGTVKDIFELTDVDLANVVGSSDGFIPQEAAESAPYWDENKEKPSQGFYRATQTWHPQTGPARYVPGEISAVELAAPVDLVLEAPERVTGIPGEVVNVPVKVWNEGSKYVETTLGYRLDGGDWHPYGTWEKDATPEMIGLGRWQEEIIEIPVTIPKEPQLMQSTINYSYKNPPIEISFENNTAFTLVTPEAVNLKVTNFKITPNPVKKKGSVTVSADIVNEGAEISTIVRGIFDGKAKDEKKVTLPANGKIPYSFNLTAPDKESNYPVGISVNPNKDMPKHETTFDDNYAGGTLQVIDDAIDLAAEILSFETIVLTGETLSM